MSWDKLQRKRCSSVVEHLTDNQKVVGATPTTAAMEIMSYSPLQQQER